jgi:hypothetical protein
MEKETQWKITNERYVGYIDIMGFKDMVMRSSHAEIYEMMKGIERKKKNSAQINWVSSREDERQRSELIKTTTYSDSIIVYSKDKSYDSLYSFLCVVAGITSNLFLDKIPHKGAFAFGTMTLDTDNSIFFGQPLIDAYLLQEELAFYGVVGHGSAEIEIDNHDIDKLVFLKNYFCPFKNATVKHLTIYPFYSHPSSSGQEFDSELKQKQNNLLSSITKLRYRTSGHLRKYVDNTDAYLKFLNS